MANRAQAAVGNAAARRTPDSLTPPVASAARAFEAADAASERAAAVIRIAILAAIAVAVVVAQSAGFDHQPLEAMAAVYAAGTLVGLLIAWRGRFRTWLAYAFMGFDVLTLAATILLLGRTLGLPPGVPMALPVAGLVVVVLLHASMHYRPMLIVFGAVLFVVAMIAGTLVMPTGPADPAVALRDVTEHLLLHFQWFPIAMFVLVVVILLMTTRRTRRSIADAAEYAARAATLSRYFSPAVAEELTSRSQEAATFGERMDVGVLFADLRGFTAMAEGMDPAALARFLTEFRSRIARPVVMHGGVIDKYIGDGVMVVFGAPKSSAGDARRALECAAAIADTIANWSDERSRRGEQAVAIAIGGHWGTAFAGVLSDGRVLEYTVIGDVVNVASRLSRLPRALATPAVVSAALVEAAGGVPDDSAWTPLPPQTLDGHPRPIASFALRRNRPPERGRAAASSPQRR